MEAYCGSGDIAPRILDLGTRWRCGQLHALAVRERAPGTHWIGDWMGPKAGLDAVVKRKIPRP